MSWLCAPPILRPLPRPEQRNCAGDQSCPLSQALRQLRLPALCPRRVHRATLPHLAAASLPPPSSDPPPSVRINKCFREFASRRAADRFVEEGRVAVNGTVASPGQKVFLGDDVTLDGRRVQWEALQAELAPQHSSSDGAAADDSQAQAAVAPEETGGEGDDGRTALPFEERFCYLKYWKPRGVVCTADRSVRRNFLDEVRFPSARLFTVGRLDKDSTGIILLTSDGRIPNAVLRAREGHEKVYEVTADEPVGDEDCAKLAAGVVITTVAQRDRGVAKELTAATRPCGVRRAGGGGRRLLMTLREGRNRQIRRMLEALGYETVALHRVSFIGITLDEGMRPGEWRALTEGEMAVVRRAVRRAAARGTRSDAAAQPDPDAGAALDVRIRKKL